MCCFIISQHAGARRAYPPAAAAACGLAGAALLRVLSGLWYSACATLYSGWLPLTHRRSGLDTAGYPGKARAPPCRPLPHWAGAHISVGRALRRVASLVGPTAPRQTHSPSVTSIGTVLLDTLPRACAHGPDEPASATRTLAREPSAHAPAVHLRPCTTAAEALADSARQVARCRLVPGRL